MRSPLFRLRASLIHLSCSAIVASLAISIIFLLWHPGAIASLQGVSHLVLILVGVDMVLGPLMTLILFNPRKPRKLLKIDLGIVATLQVLALTYGLTSIFLARPVYIVFNVDRFSIVTAGEIVQESRQRTRDPNFQHLPVGRPQVIAARLPNDRETRDRIMFYILETGNDVHQLPEYFTDYAREDMRRAVKRSHSLERLRANNELNDRQWQAFIDTLPRPPDQLAYLPVDANARDGAAIIDAQTGAFIQLVDLTPGW